ncbi:MAG: tetratricopeptide repeat protein [Bacteroidota bacterium]
MSKSAILFTCTNLPGQKTHSPEAIEECTRLVELLAPLDAGEDFKLLEARRGSRLYFTDIAKQKRRKKTVEMVHIMGDLPTEEGLLLRSRGEVETLSPEKLAETLNNFPNLRLLVLSGCATAEMTEALLEKGVSPILVTPQTMLDETQDFYLALLQGYSIRDAFAYLIQESTGDLPIEVSTYDPDRKALFTVKGKKRASFIPGLLVREDKLHALDWRMRNPNLIPQDEGWPKKVNLKPQQDVAPSKPLQKEPLPEEKKAESKPPTPKPAVRPNPPKPAERPRTRSVAQRESLRRASSRKPIRPKTKTWVEEPNKEEKKLSRPLLVIGGGLFLAMVALFAFPGLTSKLGLGGKVASTCQFDPSDDRYHVLLIPILEQNNCEVQKAEIRDMMFNRLESLALEDGIKVKARKFDLENCAFNESSAASLATNCIADLVVWGSVYDDSLTGENTLRLNYFSANEQGEDLFLMKEDHTIPTAEARGRKLTGKLENVVHWALGVQRMTEKKYAEAIAVLTRVEHEDAEIRSSVSLLLAQCYFRSGQFDLSRHTYDQLLEFNPNDIRLYQERANLLRRMGEYGQALGDYSFVLDRDPGNLNVLISRGALYHERGDYNLALSDFNQVLNLMPELSPVLCSRAEVYAAQGNPARAMRDYNQAIQLTPEYPEAYYGKALLMQESGRVDEALAQVRKALEINPEYEAALLFEGKVMEEQGKEDDALIAYTRILERKPTAMAYRQRGSLYLKLGEYQEAITDLSKAIDYNPNFALAWRERGQARFALQEYEKAIQNLNQALSIDAADPIAYMARGDAYAAMEKFDGATFDYAKVIELQPRNAEPHVKKGLIYLSQKDYDQAFKAMNDGVQAAPSQAMAYLGRGRAYLAKGNTGRAMNDFNRAIALDPRDGDAYYFRAKLHRETGQLAAAERDLQAAIQAKTSYFDAYLVRAEVYRANQQYVKALAQYSEALRLNPNQPLVYYRRGDEYLRLRQYEKALADYQKAMQMKPVEEPNTYLKRAIALANLQEPDYNGALADLTRVIRAYPDSARAYAHRAMIQQRMGRQIKASEDLDKALALQPELALVYLCKGRFHQGQNEFTPSMENYNQAIQLDRNYADAYLARGGLYTQLEEEGEALNDFNQAIRNDPSMAEAYELRADLHKLQGRTSRAIADYTKVLEFEPENADAFYKRGFMYSLQKSYPRAISDLEQSVKLNATIGLRYGTLAKIYARTGQVDKSLQNIQYAIDLDYPSEELSFDPSFDNIRNTQAFQDLMSKSQ